MLLSQLSHGLHCRVISRVEQFEGLEAPVEGVGILQSILPEAIVTESYSDQPPNRYARVHVGHGFRHLTVNARKGLGHVWNLERDRNVLVLVRPSKHCAI